MDRKELTEILKEFGGECYWYSEDTGDYDCHYLDEEECEKYRYHGEENFLKKTLDKILDSYISSILYNSGRNT